LEEIPCKVKRKQAIPYKHNKDCLVTGVKIEELGQMGGHSLKVDGNHRFLLGDFTVTS
jgi:hypothetical protein